MIVLDASALVEVVLGLPHSRWVLTTIAEADEVVAPAHQLVEVASAVARLERAGTLTPDVAEAAVTEAARLPQRAVSLDARLVARSFTLRGSLRVADAFYVALAERLDAVLVTTDERLARSAAPCRLASPASA